MSGAFRHLKANVIVIKKLKYFLSGPGLNWFLNILIAGSLAFLCIYLYKFDFLSLKNIRLSPFPLILSLIFLFIALLLGALGWWMALIAYNINIDISTAIISHSRSVLAKYMPGTLWGVVGRAAQISKMGFRFTDTSFVSTKLQVMNITIGLLLGVAPLVFINEVIFYRIPLLLFLGGLIIVIISVKLQDGLLSVLIYRIRPNFNFPSPQGNGLLKVNILLFIQYIFYSLAFLFLVKSFFPNANLLAGLAFPFSVNFGVLVVVFPGGIGVREGAMSWFLNLIGIPLSIAVTISIVARLWSIVGEVALFILGLWLERKKAKTFNKLV
jgi:uncharacterized membrane protein YbhN (UPF0104 family)